MATEDFNGQMDHTLKDIGQMGKQMVEEYLKLQTGNLLKENGRKTRQQV